MGLLGLVSEVLGGKQRVSFIVNGNAVIQFDASMKETHSRESPPTEFPVENGDVITDHVIVKPQKLELTGIISDTPIGGIGGLLTEAATTVASSLLPPIGVVGAAGAFALFSALSNSDKPSVAAYGQLLNLQSSAQAITVITSLHRYENMYISSISVPREAETGNILLFTVTLVQLLIVQAQSVNIGIFANPGLSSNKADLGDNGMNLGSEFAQGRIDGNTAASTRVH